jgi:hypothetical protein
MALAVMVWIVSAARRWLPRSHCGSAFKWPIRRISPVPPPIKRKLPHPHWHNADTVEWRAIDQLCAHDGVDQHILLRIDRTMDLKRLEEQRG